MSLLAVLRFDLDLSTAGLHDDGDAWRQLYPDLVDGHCQGLRYLNFAIVNRNTVLVARVLLLLATL